MQPDRSRIAHIAVDGGTATVALHTVFMAPAL